VRRIIWLVVIALGGGGIFYAFHPKAKSCEAVVQAGNSVTSAMNSYKSGQPIGSLLAEFASTSQTISAEAGSLRAPFNGEARQLSSILNNLIADANAGDINTFSNDVQAYNNLATQVNGDCRNATN